MPKKREHEFTNLREGGEGVTWEKRASCVFEEEVDNLMHTMIKKIEIKKQYNFSVKELSLTP